MWRVVLGVAVLAAGCVQHEAIDLTGKECPCGGDLVCDDGTNTCVPEGGGGGRTDAGPRPDAGGGDTDAGPEVDAGMPMMDASMMASPLWLEAEAATVEAPMEVADDAAASGERYVTVNAATTPSTDVAPDTGKVSFTFTVDEDGDYVVWGRAITVMDSGDSFWVRMDGGEYVQWNTIGPFAAWEWDDVHDSMMAGETVTYTLTAGEHTLDIAYREVGAQLDKIAISNDPAFVPTGLGE